MYKYTQTRTTTNFFPQYIFTELFMVVNLLWIYSFVSTHVWLTIKARYANYNQSIRIGADSYGILRTMLFYILFAFTEI